MVFSCCAFGCSNRQGKPGIRIPSNKKQRKKWIDAIRHKGWSTQEFAVLTSYAVSY